MIERASAPVAAQPVLRRTAPVGLLAVAPLVPSPVLRV